MQIYCFMIIGGIGAQKREGHALVSSLPDQCTVSAPGHHHHYVLPPSKGGKNF